MMKKLLCLGLLLAVCISFSQAAEAPYITQADLGKKFTKVKGVTFLVKLKANPSTGYSWSLDGPLTNLIQVGQSTYENMNPAAPPRAGAAQWQIFKFKGTKTGLDRIRLRYYRTWEKKKATDSIWSVTINVVEVKAKPVKPVHKANPSKKPNQPKKKKN